ncbi:MAG: hypothetical protein JNJ55_02870, partial [Betaproteobacteria bacterium]|nr:hypothetical protein [Betaproteobacteria bacterium]
DGVNPRGATVSEVNAHLAAHGLEAQFSSHVDIAAAYAAARERAGPNDRILIFGSFSTVAEILRQNLRQISLRSLAPADARSTGNPHR